MAPSLITHYEVYANAQNTNTLTTPSFTPSNGEVIVIKLATWDTATSMGAPTGGAQTYHSGVIAAPGGFNQWAGIYWCVISGSPGSMTISSTPSASSWHSMVVERWSGAQMAATPAVNSVINGSGTPSATVTTTGANSAVSTVSGDASSKDPSTRAYLSSAVEDGLQDGHIGTNGVSYFYNQACGAAGAQTVGMSAPTGQTWVLAAIEIQASSGGGGSVTAADNAAATDTVARSLNPSRPASDTAAATDTASRATNVARTCSDTAAATDSLTRATSATRAVSDIAAAADAATRTTSTTRGISDTAPAGDSVTRTIQLVRVLTDPADATDTANRSGTWLRTTLDSAPAVDTVTSGGRATGAHFALAGLSTAWAPGGISTAWSVQLGDQDWTAGELEV